MVSNILQNYRIKMLKGISFGLAVDKYRVSRCLGHSDFFFFSTFFCKYWRLLLNRQFSLRPLIYLHISEHRVMKKAMKIIIRNFQGNESTLDLVSRCLHKRLAFCSPHAFAVNTGGRFPERSLMHW